MNLSRVCRGFAALRPVTQMLSGRPRLRRMILGFSGFSGFSDVFTNIFKNQSFLEKVYKKPEKPEISGKPEKENPEFPRESRLRRVRPMTRMVPMFWQVACGAAAQHPRDSILLVYFKKIKIFRKSKNKK